MKLSTTIFILLVFSSLAFGQKMPEDYFDEGVNYYSNGHHRKAVKTFQYIVDTYPENELAPRSYYNVGSIYFDMGKYEKAKSVFFTILESNYNERESLGGAIMSDPFTNYRHRATTYLQLIHYEQQNYDSALFYLTQSDTLYPYISYCGNAISSHEVQLAIQYADLYMKLGATEKAIKSLSLCLFEDDLANNDRVITLYKELLLAREDSTTMRERFDEAMKVVHQKTTTYGDGEESYTSYWLEFLGAEIPLSRRRFMIDENNPASVASQIKKTPFYQMLLEL